MLLSRTADHLYWHARYLERAENTARMLGVNYDTLLMPHPPRLTTDCPPCEWTNLQAASNRHCRRRNQWQSAAIIQ